MGIVTNNKILSVSRERYGYRIWDDIHRPIIDVTCDIRPAHRVYHGVMKAYDKRHRLNMSTPVAYLTLPDNTVIWEGRGQATSGFVQRIAVPDFASVKAEWDEEMRRKEAANVAFQAKLKIEKELGAVWGAVLNAKLSTTKDAPQWAQDAAGSLRARVAIENDRDIFSNLSYEAGDLLLYRLPEQYRVGAVVKRGDALPAWLIVTSYS